MGRSVLRRRRTLRRLGALSLLAIGIVAFTYGFPRFAHAFKVAKSQTRKRDLSPDLPPSFRLMLERQIDEAYMSFYRWSAALGASIVPILIGTYVLFKDYKRSKSRRTDGMTGRRSKRPRGT